MEYTFICGRKYVTVDADTLEYARREAAETLNVNLDDVQTADEIEEQEYKPENIPGYVEEKEI